MTDNLSDANMSESESPSQQPDATSKPADSPKRTIKIGSQREEDVDGSSASKPPGAIAKYPPSSRAVTESETPKSTKGTAATAKAQAVSVNVPDEDAVEQKGKYPPPRFRRDSSELQQEIDAALSGVSIDDILSGRVGPTKGDEPKVDERYEATVIKLHGDHVFFSLPGNYEALAATKQFDVLPAIGEPLEVIVRRFNGEDGLYEVSVPGQAVSVADWSDIEEGSLIDVLVTGHNSGGLECEVNGIRGFIPVSQVSQYRVEDLEQFLNEKFTCVVTEANPDRKNLVLSRRAVLEREAEENRAK